MHKLEIDGADVPLRVVQFSGTEALAELFHYAVTVVTSEAPLDIAGLAGQKATLTMDIGGGARSVSAVVRRVEVGEAGLTMGASYHFELVPPHYKLALRRDLRIFQNKTAPEVIADVVDGAGLKQKQALSGSYPSRDYCVQYRETDWDFISRLAEEEGITLYFSSSSDGTLMLADDPSSHGVMGGPESLPFKPPGGAIVGGDHVSRFHWAEEFRSGRSTLRDYNFKKPRLLVEGMHKAAVDDDLELYDYPGLHDSPGGGKALARIRQEAEETQRATARGETSCTRMQPGFTFTLAEHPRDELNVAYLVTRLVCEGHDPQMFAGEGRTPFRADFEVIAADLQHRPARVTPRPKIVGLQTAVVVGPSGEEIHVDEYGRVKVQFHWDRVGKKDDKSSCWVRVSQPWAGAGFGAISIPRIGQEVVIGFLEGDPDRPLITGSVYHGANAPPYSLPADKTRTAIYTNSTPGGGGHNELRFEDRKGLEEVFLRAEKDMDVEIQHDRTEHVGNDETVKVDKDRTHEIGVNANETVGADKTVKVGANHTEIVGANLTVNVGANLAVAGNGGLTFTLAGDSSSIIDGSTKSEIKKDRESSVTGKSSEKVGGDQETAVSGAYKLTVEKESSVAVNGDSSEDFAKKHTVKVGETYLLECGDAKVTVKKNGDIVIEGKELKIKASGPITIEGSKLKVKSEGSVDVDASGAVKVKGGTVDLN